MKEMLAQAILSVSKHSGEVFRMCSYLIKFLFSIQLVLNNPSPQGYFVSRMFGKAVCLSWGLCLEQYTYSCYIYVAK